MITRYVNTASTPGGDGTTNATAGANRAYASLAEWQTARQAVLSEVEEVICEGSTADGGVTIDGWTTTASNYILIRTATAGRHPGKWDTSKYRIESVSNRGIQINEDFVRINGLQFQLTETTALGFGAIYIHGSVATGAELYVENCIMKGVVSAIGVAYGIYIATPAAGARTLRIRNCIAYDFINGTTTMGGYGLATSGIWTVYCYNNLAIDCRRGFECGFTSDLVHYKNCCAQNCTDMTFRGSGFNAASTDNCADVANDAPTTNLVTGSPTFVDEAGDDFHLASNDSVCKDAGVDLSGDSNFPFSDDIDGETRSTWDIGPDEYVEVGVTLQYASPNSDVNVGNWTTPTLYTKIDESAADDADYISSPVSPSNETCEVGLQTLGTPSARTDHVLRYRYRQDYSSGQLSLGVGLYQGGTLIASQIVSGFGTGWRDGVLTLTTGEATNISDYSNLRIRFTASTA
jgi:hypothetical protein